MNDYGQDLQGELLPPENNDRALIPAPRPIVTIRLPERQAEDAGDDPALFTYETRKLGREPSLVVDFVLPALQALATAVAATLAMTAVTLACKWDGRLIAGTFALFLAGGWFWRMKWYDAALWQLETITGRDLNHDGRVGRPGTFRPIVVNPAEARAEAARLTRRNQGQAELEDLLLFLTRCANVGTSENALGIPPGPATRASYAAKRDLLITLGIARWRDPEKRRKGWELCMSPAQATPLLRRHIMARAGEEQ